MRSEKQKKRRILHRSVASGNSSPRVTPVIFFAKGDQVNRIRSGRATSTGPAAEKTSGRNRSAVPGSSAKRENRPNYEKRKVRKPSGPVGWAAGRGGGGGRRSDGVWKSKFTRRANAGRVNTPFAPPFTRPIRIGPKIGVTEPSTTLGSIIIHFTDLTPALTAPATNYFSKNRTRDETRDIDATRERSPSIVFFSFFFSR